MEILLNKEDIKNIIPHREPFLLVDEIVDMVPGEKAVGIKYVLEEEYYFQGHFPEKKIMPGVLIVEALAQTGAVAALSLPEFKRKIALFAGIKDAKFRAQVVPGDMLRLEVELSSFRRGIGTGLGKAYKGDTLACTAELMFAVER